jgi:hypothetical protein
MTKLIRNTSDEEHRAFWAFVKKTAEAVRSDPAWTRAGIDLNEKHFVTYAPRSAEESDPSAPRR